MRELSRIATLALVLLLVAACSVTQIPDAALLPSTPTPTSPPTVAQPTQTPAPVESSALPLTSAAQLPTNTPGLTAAPSDTATPEPTDSPTPMAAASQGPGSLRITIVYDNTAHDPRLKADWGFAAWLECAGQIILFDTGTKGELLLGNMAELGLDQLDIDMIVLSHEHGDHTGGLDALLDSGARPVVYVPASFSPSFKNHVSEPTDLVEVKAEMEILPLKEFHSVVLGSGSMPLDALEHAVQDYIDTKLDSASWNANDLN
jgi:hypothetical protein